MNEDYIDLEYLGERLALLCKGWIIALGDSHRGDYQDGRGLAYCTIKFSDRMVGSNYTRRWMDRCLDTYSGPYEKEEVGYRGASRHLVKVR